MKEGFDVGLEMSGNPAAFRDMLANMCHGGKIAMLGIPDDEMAIDWTTVIFNMLTIKGIYGREMYETWYKMTVMLQSGLDIDPVITHRFHYTDFEKGFDAMRSGNSGKVILTWKEETDAMFGFAMQGLSASSQLSTRSATRGLVQGRARDHHAAAGRASACSSSEPVLNLCANNYLGPGRPSRGDRRRPRGAGPLGLRHGQRPLHLRHAADPQAAGSRDQPSSSAPRTRSSTPRASTPTAGCSRRCLGPRTRSSPTS